MSMIRKTLLATAVVGTGLASLSGVAMANQAPASGCSNTVEAANDNGTDRSLGDTTGGSQDLGLSNLCDIANGNEVGSGNNTSDTGGTITNGDTNTSRSNSSITETITRTIMG